MTAERDHQASQTGGESRPPPSGPPTGAPPPPPPRKGGGSLNSSPPPLRGRVGVGGLDLKNNPVDVLSRVPRSCWDSCSLETGDDKESSGPSPSGGPGSIRSNDRGAQPRT